MSKEVKIALFAIIIIAVSIWGYKFLKGRNLLSPSNTYYAEYSNVDMLTVSSPVLINGLKVGVVSDIHLKGDAAQTVVVTMILEKGITIPKDAIAEIFSTGMMGGKAMRLLYRSVCSGKDCAVSGDTLRSNVRGIMGSMMSLDEMDSYINKLKINAGELTDSLSDGLGLNDPNKPIGKSLKDIESTIANLRMISMKLDAMLGKSSGKIDAIMGNFQSISANLKASNTQINSILSNVDSTTNNLRRVDLQKPINGVNNTLDDMRKTLATSEKAIANLNLILENVNKGNGTLGKLMTNDSLFNDINRTVFELDYLLQDIRLNPKRYTHVLSLKKRPYVLPSEDPVAQKWDSLRMKNLKDN